MMIFRSVDPRNIKDNFIKCIADEWALVTAGTKDGYNMMTASWGFVGEMWGADAVAITVRPQRYTMEFLEKNDYFTLSFYGDNKAIHKICGSRSGRDTDKTAETGLHPVIGEKYVYFKEARLVLVVKKQYLHPLSPDGFTEKELIDRHYAGGDYHNLIIGKIEKVLISE